MDTTDDFVARPFSSANRVDTLLHFRPTSEVVSHFVEDVYYLDHWKGVAKRAKELCEEGIKNSNMNGEKIEAKVEYRAKDKGSLLEKLKMRDEKQNGGAGYENPEQIWEDVVDLAGVRIILYMPSANQRVNVKKMIQRIWGTNVKPRVHDGTRTKSANYGDDGDNDSDNDDQGDGKMLKGYKPIHLGYRAEHYRVPMRKTDSSAEYDYERRDQVSPPDVSVFLFWLVCAFANVSPYRLQWTTCATVMSTLGAWKQLSKNRNANGTLP
jgi:ppGpp synthetase/RelA/SpoT-type nucleotidyltranferase